MTSVSCIRIVRRAALTHLCAAALVVLAIAPITAPFATFDGADLGETSTHASSPCTKIATDVSAGAVSAGSIIPLLLAILDDTGDLAAPIDLRRNFSTVLRL